MSGFKSGALPLPDGGMRASVKVASTRKPDASPPVPSKAGTQPPRPSSLHVQRQASFDRGSFQTQHALASSFDYSSRPDKSVKVYEQTKKPARRIVAETLVQAPVDEVWRVLTDYEALPTFVPNLDFCERLPSINPGKLLVRQVACSQGALWRLEAEAILELEEILCPMGRREVRFTAISGDFQHFSGRWVVEPDASSSAGRATVLRYDISVQPRIPMPSGVVSYVVRAGLPANVKAIVQRAEQQANKRLQASGLASWAGVEEDVPLPARWEDTAAAAAELDSSSPAATAESDVATRPSGFYEAAPLPSKGPFWPRGSLYAAAAPLTADQQRRKAAKEAARSAYLGTASVPLPPAGNPDSSIQRALDEKLKEKQQLQMQYPAFGLRRSGEGIKNASIDSKINSSSGLDNGVAAATSSTSTNSSSSSASSLLDTSGGSLASALQTVAAAAAAATTTAAPVPMTLPAEVHLRRLDGFDFLHRRAVAAVTVDAPASLVWEVLTDYDHLAEFIPNLAASERIKLPPSAPANVVRVRQVGYKRMMYMCLHAESVLDLIEKPCSEIQFRQVAGDFERFQGKWMLSEGPADPELAGAGYTGPQTQLKYAMEIIIPHTGRMLGVIEPVLERVVFEDAPANLAAIKRRVEALATERKAAALEEAGEASRAATLRRRSARPRLSDMVDDFTVLCAELERCFGDKKLLPTRETMRDMNRTDLEKAITSHGGPSVVAERLGWKLQAKPRKPRGYWDSLDNVKSEVDEFIQDNDLEPGTMPLKNDFIRAGRFDLARAVERWGGLYELADELGYSVAAPVFASTEWRDHVSELAAETGLSGKQGLFELAAQTYTKRDSSNSSGSGSSDEGGSNGSSSRQNRKRSKDAKGRYAAMPTVRDEIDAW